MMTFEKNFLVEQAKKDGLKTWEDLRNYLVEDCGYHELGDISTQKKKKAITGDL